MRPTRLNARSMPNAKRCRHESSAPLGARRPPDDRRANIMNATRVEELPEIGAVHVLAVDMFIATMDAFYPETGHRLALWQELPHARKVYFRDEAKAWLEKQRPTTGEAA